MVRQLPSYHDLDTPSPLFQINVSPSTLPLNPTLVPTPITDTDFFHRVLGHIKNELDFTDISTSAAAGTPIISSNGSFNPLTKDSLHSWLLQTDRETYRGSGPSDGALRFRNPYRAELFGILAGLYGLYWSEHEAPITSGKATLYCDNKKAL